jgi:GGDEF domain-containing protein
MKRLTAPEIKSARRNAKVALTAAEAEVEAGKLLERAERFIARHGPHMAWRLAALAGCLLPKLRATPFHLRALILALDAQRGVQRYQEVAALVDEALALGMPPAGSVAGCSIALARITVLLDEGLVEAAQSALTELAAVPGLPQREQLLVMRYRSAAAGIAGDAQGAAAQALALLRALVGDAGRGAAALRADVHGMLSHCAARGVLGIGDLEFHSRIALRLGRHSGSVPTIVAPTRNLLAAFDVRSAPLDDVRAVFDSTLRVVRARRIENAAVASTLSNFARILCVRGRVEEAVEVARQAWPMFERLGFPATSMTFVHQLEVIFREGGESDLATMVHERRQRLELRERGLGDTGQILGTEAHARWASERVAERAAIRREAGLAVIEDPVTAQATRAQALAALAACFARPLGGGERLIVVAADIDDFGGVNRRHGFGIGDRLLKVVGWRLAALDVDQCARTGPDTFVLQWRLAPCDDDRARVAATRLAERVQAAVALPMGVYAPGLRLSACVSHAVFAAPWPEPGAALTLLETAVAQVHAIGPGCMSEVPAGTIAAIRDGRPQGAAHDIALKSALRSADAALAPHRARPLERSRHLIGYEALLDRNREGVATGLEAAPWSYPGLNVPVVTRESGRLIAGDG